MAIYQASQISQVSVSESTVSQSAISLANKASKRPSKANRRGMPLVGVEIWCEDQGLIHRFAPEDSLSRAEETMTIPVPAAHVDFSDITSESSPGSLILVDTAKNTFVRPFQDSGHRAFTAPEGFPTATEQAALSGSSSRIAALSRTLGRFLGKLPKPSTVDDLGLPEGALVDTLSGRMLVEHLQPGDMVNCKGGQFQKLVAIVKIPVSRLLQACFTTLRFVNFPPYTIGNDTPVRLAGGQKVLASDPMVEYEFGSAEVFVTARDFPGLTHAYFQDTPIETCCFHLVFTHPQIISANGAWVDATNLSHAQALWLKTARDDGRLAELPHTDVDALRHREPSQRTLYEFESRALLAELNHGRCQYSRSPIGVHPFSVNSQYA